MMRQSRLRLLSGLFTSLPGILFFGTVVLSSRQEYYWTTNLATGMIYLCASLFLGASLPISMRGKRFDYPWLWIFISGCATWMIALTSLGLLNMTPLCIGQDNGDGVNDYSLCAIYSVLAGACYSPVILILLLVSALLGSKLLRYLRSDR